MFDETVDKIAWGIEMAWYTMIAVFALGVVCQCCSWLNRQAGLKDDNIFEEIVEKQLENQTGISVDLTPDSPESNF